MKLIFFVLLLALSLLTTGCAQPIGLSEDPVVQKFYSMNNQELFWFSSGRNIKKAAEWLTAIESADYSGFIVNKNEMIEIREALANKRQLDKTQTGQKDQQITRLILDFLKVFQQGNIIFDYDEVSVPLDSVYLYQLVNFESRDHVSEIIAKLDCKDPDYLVLKNYLHDSITPKDTLKYRSVLLAMNYRKYLTINYQPECIIANIPETEAEYFRSGMPIMKMRTVVGRKKSPTPLLACYLTSIVTFPFWNVPYTIAVKELLPKVQKSENYLEQNNFEIVDAKGNLIDDLELNWNDYNEKNFPYFFRQATGADNSLGVLKFNLQNPFSIFLHSTSQQGAFARDFRFLSHGCIRLEKPFELADALLRGKIDLDELKGGKKNTQSKTLKLPAKIPVFIIYMPVKVEGKKVTFLKDVYGLVK